MHTAKIRRVAKRYFEHPAMRWFVLPALLYFVLYYAMQPQYFGHFSSGFYLDQGDGFQNVWNIWWVNHSLGEHFQNPYFTTMLHYPSGTSLIPQTMNIYNGLVGIVLMHVFRFNLVEAVNFAVLTGFVLGGVTMFWFIQKLYKNYWVSLIAGGLFTFSSYHFAHGFGHLQLISLEWVPLFLLAFWTFLERMKYKYAFFAAGSLFLVLLCDYYYLFWCVIVAGLWLAWSLWQKKVRVTKHNLKVFSAFAGMSLVLVGPLIFALLHLNKIDPLTGSHNASVFKLDPLSVFLPGGESYWSSLTHWYWPHLPFASETSLFFGYALITTVLIAFYLTVIKWRTSKAPSWLWFWWVILVVFGILSLGAHLKIAGHTEMHVLLPYGILVKLFPTLDMSGMPIRWIFFALIAAIILASYVLSRLDLATNKGRVLICLFVLVSFLELYPGRLPLTSPAVPQYVYFLKQLPEGAVIDNAALSGGWQLRDQTIFDKPMAFGYVTRLPQTVNTQDFLIFADLAQGRYSQLCTVYKIRYITLPPSRPLAHDTFPIIYHDKRAIIYDLKQAGGC